MNKEKIFWEDWKSFSVGVTEENSDFATVKPGWLLIVKSIAVYNSHATQTLNVYFGLVTHASFKRVEGAITLAAYDVIERRDPIYIKGGDLLRVALKGSGAATTGEIYAQGFLERVPDSQKRK